MLSYYLIMGAPTVQGLTPAEERCVRAYVGGAVSQAEAGRIAGISNPDSSAHRIFQRPRVQSALNTALESSGATRDKVARTYTEALDHTEWQARLRAADSVARIMGEMGDRDRDTDGARGSVTNFTVVVVQQAASAIETIDAE